MLRSQVTLYWLLSRFLLFRRRFTVLLTLGMEKQSDSPQREEMRNNGTLFCFTFIPFLGCWSAHVTLNIFLSNVGYFFLVVAVILCTQKASLVENKEIRLRFSACLGRQTQSGLKVVAQCCFTEWVFFISSGESFSKSLNLIQNYRHLRKPDKLERVVPVAILGERLFVIIRDFMKCFWTKGL